ncbi:GNAT family N-acetyltransferase [Nesterenkonia suensis]
MQIRTEDPRTPDVQALILEHLQEMHATSPQESVHALGVDQLRAAGVTLWAVRQDDGVLLGCGALKRLDAEHAEIKAMRTAVVARGRGVAGALVEHLIGHARDHGLRRLSLETGTEDHFAAARRLYVRHRFHECPPFGDYTEDPHSVFMTLPL